MNRDYQIASEYWSDHQGQSEESFGVADIGGAGQVEVFYRHSAELDHLRNIIRLDRTSTILELGSGNGRWALSIAPMVKHYTAVDFSKAMLDVTRARMQARGLTNVTLLHAPIQEYVPSDTFDYIYFSGVSQYLHDEDIEKLVQRLVPHLKPHGRIVDRSTVHRRRRSVSNAPSYFSIYRTADEVTALFERCGLRQIYTNQSYRFLNFPMRLQRLIRSRVVTRAIIMTAPASYGALKLGASLSQALFGRSGDVVDYSHDFFVFKIDQ